MERIAKTLYRTRLLALTLVMISSAVPSSMAQGDPPRGVVLTGEDAVELASDFFYNPPPSAKEIWQPSASDVARLEKLLPDFMRSQKALPHDYQPLNEYFRQYVGIVRNGKKIIGVNFVHSSFFETMASVKPQDGKTEDLQKRPILVMDGGAYFFHLQFDPATGSFSDLRFNGYA